MWGILWLAEELLAFSEGLCCLELIGLWNWNRPTFTAARRLSGFRTTRSASTPLRIIHLGPALLLPSCLRPRRQSGRFSA